MTYDAGAYHQSIFLVLDFITTSSVKLPKNEFNRELFALKWSSYFSCPYDANIRAAHLKRVKKDKP